MSVNRHHRGITAKLITHPRRKVAMNTILLSKNIKPSIYREEGTNPIALYTLHEALLSVPSCSHSHPKSLIGCIEVAEVATCRSVTGACECSHCNLGAHWHVHGRTAVRTFRLVPFLFLGRLLFRGLCSNHRILPPDYRPEIR